MFMPRNQEMQNMLPTEKYVSWRTTGTHFPYSMKSLCRSQEKLLSMPPVAVLGSLHAKHIRKLSKPASGVKIPAHFRTLQPCSPFRRLFFLLCLQPRSRRECESEIYALAPFGHLSRKAKAPQLKLQKGGESEPKGQLHCRRAPQATSMAPCSEKILRTAPLVLRHKKKPRGTWQPPAARSTERNLLSWAKRKAARLKRASV